MKTTCYLSSWDLLMVLPPELNLLDIFLYWSLLLFSYEDDLLAFLLKFFVFLRPYLQNWELLEIFLYCTPLLIFYEDDVLAFLLKSFGIFYGPTLRTENYWTFSLLITFAGLLLRRRVSFPSESFLYFLWSCLQNWNYKTFLSTDRLCWFSMNMACKRFFWDLSVFLMVLPPELKLLYIFIYCTPLLVLYEEDVFALLLKSFRIMMVPPPELKLVDIFLCWTPF
jgi:hypothetical protein